MGKKVLNLNKNPWAEPKQNDWNIGDKYLYNQSLGGDKTIYKVFDVLRNKGGDILLVWKLSGVHGI